ncbi:MAG: hypothetical protein CSA38_01985 [Flavobacteriales bacterium]|nr:MAG: hypothetical protein CSA38_01985 [Flavobacteriales bacterium]
MNLISDRENDEIPIFRAFVERTLKKKIKEIDKEQRAKMSGFTSDFWKDRSFFSNDVRLVYSHRPEHRFVDMKVRNHKKKKHREVHNRILMGHYAGIMGELTYGLTESVKENLRQNLKN